MLRDKFNHLKCCVIVPTYNNEKTLRRVLEDILLYTGNVIIVNDGSTDSTDLILKDFSGLEHIHFSVNRGKGYSLRKGFEKAQQLGYKYAITIDSDGQHFPEDLEVFISHLEKGKKDTILIGLRNMTQTGIPKKSSFGNKFSNFWYWVETSHTLEDTQSGFRLYPLHLLPKKWYSTKFEFEIEVIVRSAWKNIRVENVPIQIKYDQEERVSHFRPFKDFARISVLNTVLVTIAIVYIKPRDFIRHFKKKTSKLSFMKMF